MPDGLVDVACDKGHVRNVIGCRPQALGELGAREDVVPIYVVLKKDLAARVKIENAAVHAGDIEREQTTPVRESPAKVFWLS